jgi:lysophospholipase L1-like esterase
MRAVLERIPGWLRQQHSGAPGWLLALSVVVALGAGTLFGMRALAADAPVTGPVHPVAVFLGDSYTQGVGASVPSRRWTTLVSKAAGWREENLGRGGTGYLATADVNGCGLQFCPNFEQMVRNAIDEDPDVVVVSGGQNDFSAWPGRSAGVRAAIDDVYRRLRRALPTAEIFAVGPSTTGTVEGPVVEMDAAVRAAARKEHAHYVSLTDPDVITPSMVLKDGGHVDDAGHAAIARRVLAAVRSDSAA